MLYNLEEKTETKFAQGLGKASNNQVEELSLWQGLKISISKGIKKLIIVGDSMVVIQKCTRLSRNELLFDLETSPLVIRIMYLLRKLKEYKKFHVKRENNNMVDLQANKGVELEQGILYIDHYSVICHDLK